MTFVLMFGVIVNEGRRQGLGLDSIFRLLPYAMPIALRFSVPASLLMSTCSVFGRMSADNEIVAAKSLGINPRTMLYPAFGVAVVLSIGMIWLNDISGSWGFAGMRTVVYESVEEVVFRKLKTERSFRNKYFSINVKRVEGRKLIEPRFEIRGDEPIVVEARVAEMQTDLKAEQLKILLTDSTADQEGKIHIANAGTFPYIVPLSEATMKDRNDPSVSDLGLRMISKEAIAQQAKIRSIEQELAARAAFQMVMGDISQLNVGSNHADGATWKGLHRKYAKSKSRLNRLHLEPWRRCAEGFSCLFIVMVGAPLAIQMRTTNFFTTFAMCFFPVLCIYYPVLMWAVDRVKDGELPPYSVWLGNGLLLIIGILLTRKVVRY